MDGFCVMFGGMGEGLSLVRSACEGAGEGGGGRGGHDYQLSVTGLVVTGLDSLWG